MEILENKKQWHENYRSGWLAANDGNEGKTDWSLYQHPRNQSAPGTRGLNLANGRLMLISSSGAYIPGKQAPFDDEALIGDYSLRRIPSALPLPPLEFSHGHYDEQFIRADVQVAIPLSHLRAKVTAGEIKELAPTMISFMGYQPDASRVVDELAPQVLKIALEEQIDAAVLAPL